MPLPALRPCSCQSKARLDPRVIPAVNPRYAGSGWSIFKPFLSERDKRIVMIILPLQVINNIALVITEVNRSWV